MCRESLELGKNPFDLDKWVLKLEVRKYSVFDLQNIWLA